MSMVEIETFLLRLRDAGYSRSALIGAYVNESKVIRMIRKAKTFLATQPGKDFAAKNGINLDLKSTPIPKGTQKTPEVTAPEVQIKILKDQLGKLRKELFEAQSLVLTHQQVREGILGLASNQPSIPSWVNDRREGKYHHGIPNLVLSDLHHGEVVDPQQVFGVNDFNSKISERRIRSVVDTTIELTRSVLERPDFPGFVLNLNGDMINGLIHDELQVGSDQRVMSQVVDLADILHSCIIKLIKEYGRVFVPGVPGNHGRVTKKPWAKFNAETNFDWLIYQILERFLKPEVEAGRLTFLTPPARDITYKVAGRRFRASHGDQFRGGDGIIGPLGPITRGDKKKRAMAMSLPHDHEHYETLIVGHFHTLFMTAWLIINGSTKGFDEYALSNNFSYEPPQQALFLVHEKYGINHFMPVLADRPTGKITNSFVEV